MLCCWIHKICQTFEMHQYIFISIIYWKNKQQCNQLLSNITSFIVKNCSAEQKLHNKKGSRAKKLHCKKLQQNHNEKCFMCEWDHWNNIGANPVRYCDEFAMSKSWQICIMCVTALNVTFFMLTRQAFELSDNFILCQGHMMLAVSQFLPMLDTHRVRSASFVLLFITPLPVGVWVLCSQYLP